MKKDAIKTTKWDPSEHLQTEEEMQAYFEAALEDGDPALISAVLDDIEKAKSKQKQEKMVG